MPRASAGGSSARIRPRRLVAAYGSRLEAVLGDARERADLGPAFGPELTGAEVRYLMAREWARFPGRHSLAALQARPDHAAAGSRGAGGVHGGGGLNVVYWELDLIHRRCDLSQGGYRR